MPWGVQGQESLLSKNYPPQTRTRSGYHSSGYGYVGQQKHIMNIGFIGLGLMLPATAAAAQLFNAIVGSGMGEEDSISALKLLEKISSKD